MQREYLADHEFPDSHGIRFCSDDSHRCSVLPIEAEARGESGVQFLTLAKISGRDTGECAVSKTEKELAALSSVVDVDSGDSCSWPALSGREVVSRRLGGCHPGCLRIDEGDGCGADTI